MCSKAASTRRALVAGQLLPQHLNRDVEGRRRKFVVFDPISDRIDGQPLGVADGRLTRLSVGHDARKPQRLGNPAAVIYVVSPARYRNPLGTGGWWALKDLNLRPTDYESAALTAELRAQSVCLQ